jgi:hypothetical protein
MPMPPVSWPTASIATCFSQFGARYVGNARAAPEQRVMLAVLPKVAVEQAANIRVVLDWN